MNQDPDSTSAEARSRARRDQDRAAFTRRRKSLGRTASVGVATFVVASVAVRVIRFVGIFLLSWLLLPEDFSLWALTAACLAFTTIIRDAGVRPLLIRRGYNAYKWANPGFWLSLSSGLVVAVGLIIAARPIAELFGRPNLTWMLIFVGAVAPLPAVIQVPRALLQAQLRFKTTALIDSVTVTLQMLLTILFAWMGMGALSFVLPIPICDAINFAWSTAATRPPIRLNPQFRLWKYMIGNSLRVMSSEFAMRTTLQGDQFVMGMFASPTLHGVYGLSYQVARQPFQLFGKNLTSVLFPSLASLKGVAGRRYTTYLKAIQLVSFATMPICYLQAVLAPSVVPMLLPQRFEPAVPFIVILSIGLAGRMLSAPAISLMSAQGRFKTIMTMAWIYAACFITSGIVGGYVAGAMGITVAVAFNLGVWGYIYQIVAQVGEGSTWSAAIAPTRFGFIGGAIAAAAASVIDALIAGLPPIILLQQAADLTRDTELTIAALAADAARASCVALTFLAVYLGLARRFARESLRAVSSRSRQAMDPIARRVKKKLGR